MTALVSRSAASGADAWQGIAETAEWILRANIMTATMAPLTLPPAFRSRLTCN